MKRILAFFFGLSVFLLAGLTPTAAAPEQQGSCRYFSETNFNVCDDAQASFLTAFNRYGLQNVGYPVSRRYERAGFVTQAFQKAIFQWRPETSSVAFVNIFDDLSRSGKDIQLFNARQTPGQLPTGWEGNVSFEQAVQKRQGLLTRSALRSTYFSVSNPLLFFGLPTSEIKDMGNHYAIRMQRAVLQEWKENVPWARAGQVTIANGGDIAKEMGYLPSFALQPGSSVAAPVAPAPIAVAPAPVAPAPVVVAPPASAEPGRNLDSRLGALGVGIAPANVAPGQPYWRVVEVIFHSEAESGGRHAIQIDVLDERGGRIVGQPVTISWGGGSAQVVIENKPFPEYGANYPMYNAGCSYSVSIGGLPSESVTCLGLGDLGEARNWRKDHVEYLVKFQKVIKR